MGVPYPTTAETAIVVWFGVSLLLAVVGHVFFFLWLSQRGVRLVFGLVGVPGYMERAYMEWCRSQGQCPNKTILRLRAISMGNLVAASLCFILLVTSR